MKYTVRLYDPKGTVLQDEQAPNLHDAAIVATRFKRHVADTVSDWRRNGMRIRILQTSTLPDTGVGVNGLTPLLQGVAVRSWRYKFGTGWQSMVCVNTGV